MSLLSKAKINEVKFGLENYVFLLRGEPKSGKTSTYAEIIKAMYKDETKGLLIPFEKGYSAIKGVNHFPVTILPETVLDGETYRGWELFTQLVDELCAAEGDEKIHFIAIDTVDELIKVCEHEVIRLSRIKTKKVCDSIDAAFGGFARGKKKVQQMIKDQIEKLRSANIGIMFIGHTKTKKLKTKIDNEEYMILGSNLTEDYDKIFANDADFIVMITQENEIVDGKMVAGERFLRFRGDGFFNAGSRFPNVPEKIRLDAKLFVDTIKAAVMELNGISDEDVYEERVKAESIELDGKAIDEKEHQGKLAEELVGKMKQFVSTATSSQQQQFIELIGTHNVDTKNPRSNDITVLKDVCTELGIEL